MKRNSHFSILIILIAIFMSTNFTAFSQSKDVVDDVKLSVTKLKLGERDITDSLGVVNIANKIWTEFDRHGKEIGRASVIKNSHNEIHVKWISATNGAKKDGVTIYKVTKEGTQYTFDIYFENKKQGYFIASAE